MLLAIRVAMLTALIAASAACGESDQSTPATGSPSTQPALGATATAIGSPQSTDFARSQLTTLVSAAESPVDLEFAPDGRLFYNELRTGRIRIVNRGQLQPEPFVDLDVVNLTDRYSEHGLLGLALDPEFETNRFVYVFLSVPDRRGDPSKQQVLRLTDDGGEGVDPTVILGDLPVGESRHNGGRLAFGPDGMLYVSIGDGGDDPESAQETGDRRGKILRVNPDGSVPNDNPLSNSPVWAIGLRNVFGLAFAPDGTLYATENSDSGHDEVNRILRGGNYGWPEVTGVSDDGRFLDPIAESGGDESWAPTGIAAREGELFFCSYNRGTLLQVVIDRPRRAVGHIEDTEQPCSFDVTLGPDGALYLAGEDAIYRWGPP